MQIDLIFYCKAQSEALSRAPDPLRRYFKPESGTDCAPAGNIETIVEERATRVDFRGFITIVVRRRSHHHTVPRSLFTYTSCAIAYTVGKVLRSSSSSKYFSASQRLSRNTRSSISFPPLVPYLGLSAFSTFVSAPLCQVLDTFFLIFIQ